MMENSDGITGSDDLKKLQNLDTRTESNEETTEEQRDGGTVGWISIFGSWLVSFSTFGYFFNNWNFGVIVTDNIIELAIFLRLEYIKISTQDSISPTTVQAKSRSFQLMMPFLFGLVSGKLFDAGYFHALVITGSALFTIRFNIPSLFMLSLVKPQHYAQVFLSQGVGMGVGLGLTFVPTVSSIVHHFQKRKVLATGIVMSGSSLGGIVFPISEYWTSVQGIELKAGHSHLIPSIGFPKAVRASGYLVLGMLVLANCLMKSAYPKSTGNRPQVNILSFFTDPPYIFATLG
ncbi:MFS-type transporter eupM [Psilocybe cubensis]|uniref:MFS-type transporter eupM n=1 Tax=Psilocybe cubensis TaxID=181762 RepID=A0ACB8GGW4_PSICU|nr:MFS-type transporter eupM [Psilocybe cubensis]KAH9474891.1 MFS-type transporter eupM [Psilocybe cubensis]